MLRRGGSYISQARTGLFASGLNLRTFLCFLSLCLLPLHAVKQLLCLPVSQWSVAPSTHRASGGVPAPRVRPPRRNAYEATLNPTPHATGVCNSVLPLHHHVPVCTQRKGLTPRHAASRRRCRRLSKACTSQVHLPRKRRTTHQKTRTAHLEERLNSLVDLLRASGEIPPQDPTPPSTSDDAADVRVVDVPSTWNICGPPRCVCRATHGKINLHPLSDDQVLHVYRTQLVPVFPFVAIGPATEADRLKAERPLLFEALSMAASIHDIRTMRGQMYQLMRRIADAVLLFSTKSMDVLQALLVMLAWHQNHCVMHAQMNNLLYLAHSQMADLRLHTDPAIHERTGLMVLNIKDPPPRTNEERRVALGVWFLTSS